jgi:hypothetical protein
MFKAVARSEHGSMFGNFVRRRTGAAAGDRRPELLPGGGDKKPPPPPPFSEAEARAHGVGMFVPPESWEAPARPGSDLVCTFVPVVPVVPARPPGVVITCDPPRAPGPSPPPPPAIGDSIEAGSESPTSEDASPVEPSPTEEGRTQGPAAEKDGKTNTKKKKKNKKKKKLPPTCAEIFSRP